MRLSIVAALSAAVLAFAVGARSSASGESARVGGDGQSPAAWYRFAAGAAPGLDASGHGNNARVVAATVEANGLHVNGQGGLEVSDAPALRATSGFSVDCRVRFDSVTDSMTVVAKEGEYMIRVDPVSEESRLSFFVNCGGMLEPRVRGPVVRPGVAYHLIAIWDGQMATLWVNDSLFRSPRSGGVAPTASPVRIGLPTQWSPCGLKGALSEVKLYGHALSVGDILSERYGLRDAWAGGGRRTAAFTFESGAPGWEFRNVRDLQCAAGALRATVQGDDGLLLNHTLNAPTEGQGYISVRMAATGGHEASLLCLTTGGVVVAPFPLRADGRMHSYVVRTDALPEWNGRLKAVGIVPSDAPAHIAIAAIKVGDEPQAPPEVEVTAFLTDKALCRALKPCRITATLRNVGGGGTALAARLIVPQGVNVSGSAVRSIARLGYEEARQFSWLVRAGRPFSASLRLEVSGGTCTPIASTLAVDFLPHIQPRKEVYVPAPRVAASDYLVGAMYCPLWKQGARGDGWERIVPYPERKPALGWFDEDNPEVTDWDIKWCLEHGISYFVYCWYRKSQNRPVEMFLSHAIHDGLFHARYRSKFRFAIMWENASRGTAGVSSEADLLQNLLPFWIKNYFKRPEYLKIDNKPMLFIYRPEYLVQDLGSVEKVRSAFDKIREACKRAGFAGITLLGEYRGTDPAPVRLMASESIDCCFSYCTPVAGRPTAAQAMQAQVSCWETWRAQSILPFIPTVSMGWDSRPWYWSGSEWRLTPDEFRRLAVRARTEMRALPAGSPGRRMALLDNWNEFGEGHYIAPHRQYGFGYLDAVRAAFTTAPAAHTDLVPEDIGRGPYDGRFRSFEAAMAPCARRIVAPGGSERGLIGWWTFGEAQKSRVAFDYSGHGLGGIVDGAVRTAGTYGKALVCRGGSVTVPGGTSRFGLRAITVECRIRTDVPAQTDKWFVNNIYGDGASGFRLGLSGGKLAWAIPETSWSHQLNTDAAVPLNAWVHVAGTYDGRTMRVYVDGVERGSLQRSGLVHPTDAALCIGSYAAGHVAHFTGLLEDVRIYARALTAQEIRAQARR